MPRPGTQVTIVDDAPSGGLPLETGTAFAVGIAERGSTAEAVLVRSASEYEDLYGVRAGGSLLYDSVNAFFREGGSRLYISRVLGAASAKATLASFGTALKADAASAGTWGNGLTIASAAAVAPASGFVITVRNAGAVVEVSPGLATAQDAVNWFAHSSWVRFTLTGAGSTALAVVAATPLAGGTTVAGAADDVTAAIARFAYGLGPGQVLAPGYTDSTTQLAVLAHCDANKRVALLDAVDTAVVATLTSAAGALYGQPGARMASLWAPWVNYPGPAGSVVTIPFSPIEAAMIARSDARTLNPNQAAAGANGAVAHALSLSQTFSDAERTLLNAAGVNVVKVQYEVVKAYGARTVAGPNDTNWLWFSNSRVVMTIAYEADAAAENYVFQQIDGNGHLFAALEADLRGVCLKHFNRGALYGTTPEEAYQVDTGAAVNTPTTIAAGEVHAVIRLRISPTGEWVAIEVVKVPTDVVLATPA